MSSLDLLVNSTLEYFEGSLSEGERAERLRCPAPDCNREFTSKRNLVDHYRGHHQGIKPHVCDYPGCGKSFLRPAHLLIHNRIHTGEKPFVCQYEGCGKRWNQKSALKQHMRSHTGEKPFVCTMEGCTKSFSTSSSCKRHISTHSVVMPKVELGPKRKLTFPATYYTDSSDDEMCDQRPMKKQSLSSVALNTKVGQVADELARKMTLNFILN